ncbi:MAG: hypothetical protein EOP60_09225 [Sphingomonadales bacterium]|nr:MAG: hypothetical protein EOP60_09225 [Sphingomonadales bacterium]
MRAVLLALALLWLPSAASAQPAGQPASVLQRVGIWVQQMAAAQKPVIDAYELCRPTMARVGDMLKNEERMKPDGVVAGEMRACVSRLHDAAEVTRDKLAAMPPMPAEMDRMLGLDSASLMKRAAASVEGMVEYLDRVNQAFDALQNEDPSAARMRMAEARSLAGAVMDGQIVLLETIRQTLPMDTHKSMMDIRLAITRTVREVAMADALGRGPRTAKALVALRRQASDAAAQLRANWKREGAGLHAMAAGGADPRAAQLAALDEAFSGLAQIGDALAALLEPAEFGPLSGDQSIRILDGAALLEARALSLVQSFAAVAASK